ncbi:hypothetical protein F511_16144 [Dorcoceras hygrometricum]|uniref:Helicase ATP-binding domain-containing protein n=1 Tax=Dorcoceras hygrometricum TaxID=472368 RepID=A0A2Z7DG05_9LAMI|nr:hypothetical protein F511_16144 [Dorcoceras hygrometricum]
MLVDLPRLTNSLRVPFDVDQAYLNRKALLRSLKAASSSAALHGEWELARKIVYQWDEASAEVRQAYKQYIAAVVELMGGEVVSGEFHEVALYIYHLFNVSSDDKDGGSVKRLSDKKFELEKFFGHSVPDANLRKLASLVDRLSGLQKNQQRTMNIPESMSVGGEELEFGADLPFQPPARFVVDFSLDHREITVDETSTSLSQPEGSSNYGGSASVRPHNEGNFDLEWLRDACDKIVSESTSHFPRDELAMTICQVLDSEKPGDEHRKELVECIHHGLLVLKSDRLVSNTQPRLPSYATQVTVQTESERQIDKLRRKEEKKNRRGTDHGMENDFSSLTFSSLVHASEKKNLFDDLVGYGDGSQLAATALPKGTVRKHYKGYEEVTVPAMPNAPMKPGEKLIEIKELDDFAQAAFHGYKSLNRIQSRIYQKTYFSNENILVCAPTGAGKTNIAMISILHEIGQHLRDGYLHKEEFKIVYVAPMKALAAEVTSTFSHRLSPLNITVRELTGDMQLSKNELEETQMIVTTPEKWDVITRKSSDMSLSMLVKLLIIDEVHLLNDDRGPVIEALVARTLRQVVDSVRRGHQVMVFVHSRKDTGKTAENLIFGRAGRPQFDKSGEGIIITSHEKLAYYLRLLTSQLPIESQFINSLKDNLNAEVALGTVTNVKEACAWLGYTYLFIRMKMNPLAYGIGWDEVMADPSLSLKQRSLVSDSARALDKAKMMRFDEKSGNFYCTELGRIASHFYIQYSSVETYNEMLKRHMSDSEVIDMVAHSSEFENIVVREEEQNELEIMTRKCPLEVKGGPSNKHGKVSILIQMYISRGSIDAFSLVSDAAYISSSLARVMRALFEICLRRGWSEMSSFMLDYCKAVDRQIWPHQHPLRQFDKDISAEILRKLEEREVDLDNLYEMQEKDIGALIRYAPGGKLVKQFLGYFPMVQLFATVSPITRTVLKVDLTITPEFVWKDRFHGPVQRWWILVEDSENDHIYHSELFSLTKRMAKGEPQKLSFTVPIFEPHPPQYIIRAISDSWLHAEAFYIISIQNLALPEAHTTHTELLDLKPLPVTALSNRAYEALYNFSHFNPIQTQAFHVLYHTDQNVLLGAPTGSGKTISAELAMLHLFNTQPDMKVIYIAPLKALVRERMNDWRKRLVSKLGKHMVEMTGDYTPDLTALLSTDIIISTPEKWDGISRNWHSRGYVKKVGLMILDEIHLLGADRGPILEVIVSRMRYISSQTDRPVRFVGLSTALANANDLADWLGVEENGLFNFKPSVRPVPLEVHIQGYPGKYYCPRMNSMNKPTYAAICTHSPIKPVLIFVSSRRQTRLTALDLLQFAASDERPRQFLAMPEEALQMILSQVVDQNLRHTLQFGIGLHHAGLNDKDRSLVEELFANNKIQAMLSIHGWKHSFELL